MSRGSAKKRAFCARQPTTMVTRYSRFGRMQASFPEHGYSPLAESVALPLALATKVPCALPSEAAERESVATTASSLLAGVVQRTPELGDSRTSIPRPGATRTVAPSWSSVKTTSPLEATVVVGGGGAGGDAPTVPSPTPASPGGMVLAGGWLVPPVRGGGATVPPPVSRGRGASRGAVVPTAVDPVVPPSFSGTC